MSLRLLIVTDHHLGADACTVNRGYAPAWALERVLDAIAGAGRHGADALVSTGDLVDNGTDGEYAFARTVLGVPSGRTAPGPLVSTRPGLEGLPIYLVPGNHDPREAWIRNLFPETEASDRLDLAWSIDGHRFVHLDLGTSGRAGQLSEPSLATLDDELARHGSIVLVLHHHPVAVGVPWLDRALPDGIERLWARIDRGVIAVFFGHAHASIDTVVNGVPVLGTRSTCFQFAASEEPSFVMLPLEYRLVTIDGTSVESTRFRVPLAGPAVSARAA